MFRDHNARQYIVEIKIDKVLMTLTKSVDYNLLGKKDDASTNIYAEG